MPYLNQAERQTVRKLAFRYASMLQQRMYESVAAELLAAVDRGDFVRCDCDAARLVAFEAAKKAIDTACPAMLSHT